MKNRIGLGLISLLFAGFIPVAVGEVWTRALYLRDFGGKADGRTDDGPAILRMVEAARAMKGKPVRLVFPSL